MFSHTILEPTGVNSTFKLLLNVFECQLDLLEDGQCLPEKLFGEIDLLTTETNALIFVDTFN